MLGRFYAICNCCKCCCGAMQAHLNGVPMLASSGYVASRTRPLHRLRRVPRRLPVRRARRPGWRARVDWDGAWAAASAPTPAARTPWRLSATNGRACRLSCEALLADAGVELRGGMIKMNDDPLPPLLLTSDAGELRAQHPQGPRAAHPPRYDRGQRLPTRRRPRPRGAAPWN